MITDGGKQACGGCLSRLTPPDYENSTQRTKHIDETFGAFAYEGLARDAILHFKDHGRVSQAKFFAKAAHEMHSDTAPLFDCIIPVPLHKNRLKSRGFNQSLLFGQWLAHAYKKPIYDGLVRNTDTLRLYEIKGSRSEYLRGAFELRRGFKADGRRILLVDDILTSGATIDECGKILKDAGAAEVRALAIALTARK